MAGIPHVVLVYVRRRAHAHGVASALGLKRGVCAAVGMAEDLEAVSRPAWKREEALVNSWLLEYYSHAALAAFRAGRSTDFTALRNVLSALIVRPLKPSPRTSKHLRLMQYLSRIEEGEYPERRPCADPVSLNPVLGAIHVDRGADDLENADCTGETPLESAVAVLKLIEGQFPNYEAFVASSSQMLKEAAVVVCIKNQQFARASLILKKHLADDSSRKELKAELMEIIRKKNLMHPMIKNFCYKTLKQKVLQLLDDFTDDLEPFLKTIAKNTLANEPESAPERVTKKRVLAKEREFEPEWMVVDEPAKEPSRPESRNQITFSLSALKAAFENLSYAHNPDAVFSKLCKTDFVYQEKGISIPFFPKRPRREECAASDTHTNPPPPKKNVQSIDKLIMEIDSQISDSSLSPELSLEQRVIPAANSRVFAVHDKSAAIKNWNTLDSFHISHGYFPLQILQPRNIPSHEAGLLELFLYPSRVLGSARTAKYTQEGTPMPPASPLEMTPPEYIRRCHACSLQFHFSVPKGCRNVPRFL